MPPPHTWCRQRPSVLALLSALLLMLPANASDVDADAESGGPPPELNRLFQWAIGAWAGWTAYVERDCGATCGS